MNLEKLLEIESRQGFDDVNAIRGSRIRSFLDEWIVTGLLGRGSFGNVYQITKPQDGMSAQKCALKICQVNNEEDAEIRRQEIETQRLLNGHPNAVQIEDYALISREPPRVSYLLIRMELLSPMPSDGLDEREAIRLGIDICSVLEKCASLEPKLVHCDIKPANILVAEDGRYKLGDFGTAKTLQATMTYTGNRGTPLYMAPEVASYTGYDSRCDIFSLGYTMLTMLNGGKHPYQDAGDRSDILREMYESKKLPQIKGVSSGLMKIIRKMCDPNLGSRYSRASEVRRDLELYVRKKEEAERIARLEAERQAEIAKQKAKAERARNIKLAESTLEKAAGELFAARNALDSMSGEEKRSAKNKVKLLEANCERASRAHRYVMDGSTFDAAMRKVREEDAEAAKLERLKFIKDNKKIWFAGVAVWVVLVVAFVAGTAWLGGREKTEPDNELDNKNESEEQIEVSKSEIDWEKYALNIPAFLAEVEADNIADNSTPELPPVVTSEEEVTTPDGFILIATNDRQGYKVVGQNDKYITELTIPSEHNGIPVLEIGDLAFCGSSVNRIVIPEGIVSIGVSAFATCSKLKNVSIPESVEKIGGFAFYQCTSLREIDLPDSLKELGYGALSSCTSLKNIVIPSGITRISRSLFLNCTSMEEVAIPDGISLIEKWAFRDCTSLSEISIPESVTTIDVDAFRACTSLETISIPENVSRIVGNVFMECNALESIEVSEENTAYISYDGILFTKDFSRVIACPAGKKGQFFAPGSLSVIGQYAFYGSKLEKINLPDGVLSIEDNAFYGCASINEFAIPETVTEIGNKAFAKCRQLVDVAIPESAVKLGNGVFVGCSSLESVKLPDGITAINGEMFMNCKSLTEINIPNSVTIIGDNAFYCCTSIKTIEIPEGVTTIGNQAFYECTSLQEIDLPGSLISIGSNSFSHCYSLVEVIVPGSVKEMQPCIFHSCTKLNRVEFLEGVVYISESAFDGCYSLQEIIIPKSVVRIEPFAFDSKSLTVYAPYEATHYGDTTGIFSIGTYGLWRIVE